MYSGSYPRLASSSISLVASSCFSMVPSLWVFGSQTATGRRLISEPQPLAVASTDRANAEFAGQLICKRPPANVTAADLATEARPRIGIVLDRVQDANRLAVVLDRPAFVARPDVNERPRMAVLNAVEAKLAVWAGDGVAAIRHRRRPALARLPLELR